MSTQCFFRAAVSNFATGNTAQTYLSGSTGLYAYQLLSTTRGSTAALVTVTSVLGPTTGIEMDLSTAKRMWVSEPLTADVTISGTITFNMRMVESAMTTNAGAQVEVSRIDPQGNVTVIVNSEFGTEMPQSSLDDQAANNWTANPTSTAFFAGDRIRVRVAANDAGGTMAAGGTIRFGYDGPSAAAAGDSYVTFTETISFDTSTAAGTKMYFTNTAASGSINPGAATEKDLWTTIGTSVQDATATPAGSGPRSPEQVKISSVVAEWYSRALNGFTLTGGRMDFHLYPQLVSITGFCSFHVEVYTTDNNGTNPVLIAQQNSTDASNGVVNNFEIGIPTVDLSAGGRRLMVKVYFDDSDKNGALGASTLNLRYNDQDTPDAAGDSWLQIKETVTEGTAATAAILIPRSPVYPKVLPH